MKRAISNNKRCITMYVATAVAVLILSGPLASEGRGDFTLRDDDQLTVNSAHALGTLYNESHAELVLGGSVTDSLNAYGASTVNVSGGSVEQFDAFGASIVNISGGWVYDLRVYDTCSMTLSAREFSLGDGLSLDGDRVLGTGSLIAEWFDGAHGLLNITRNDSGATILAIPEPAALSLLALGGFAVLRRRKGLRM